jgi:hypothetical protein
MMTRILMTNSFSLPRVDLAQSTVIVRVFAGNSSNKY